MTIKRWHFAAAAQYRKSCEDLGANRYGDELGRLRLAEANVKKAVDSPKKGTSDALQGDLKSLQGIIAANISRAAKDNDLIYLEPVTPASSLAPITAASMVDAKTPAEVMNPISFLRDAPNPAFGKPLFRELIPYGVHVAISIFEDRKDTFVRQDIEMKREELDSLAASALQSLNLPGSLQAMDQPVNLPPSLVRKSEEVQLEGGMQRLQALEEDVARVGRVGWDILREITSILRQEETESANARQSTQMDGESNEQAMQYRQKIEEYEQTMMQARQSDGQVQSKMREWQQSITILASGQEALKAYIPLQARAVTLNQAQSVVVRALRVELEGLDDLIDSRAAVVEEAKALSRQHDIRPTIMREAGIISSGNRAPLIVEAAHFEPLFDKEMQPFETLREEIDASEGAQEERLEIIRQRNEAFVESRKVDSLIQKREQALQTMDLAYSKYRELSANLVEGLKVSATPVQRVSHR
jgi:programmed cell death 6-interacting protein